MGGSASVRPSRTRPCSEMKLSICLTYYNALEYLQECLESIREHAPASSYEVVIVDDASERSCEQRVGEVFPAARVIVNERNLGFAGANNVAWTAAAGEYVLFLNTDTKILPGALDELVDYLDGHPEAGAVGPMVLNDDRSFQPQCRRGWLTPLSGLAYSLRLDRVFPTNPTLAEYLMRYTDRDRVQPVRALSGCCMMFRKVVLEAHGGLDEELHQYGEDLDLCYRIGNEGWQIVYDPRACIVHYGGKGGTNLRVVRSLYFFHRSMWIIFRRYNESRWFLLYGWLALLMLAVRFALASTQLLLGNRRAGTRKGAQRFRRETAPDAQTGTRVDR